MSVQETNRIGVGAPGGISFERMLHKEGLFPLRAQSISILQMNITRRCNLSCRHCHVGAGPQRTEEMTQATLDKCLEIAALPQVTTIDITGGAPEMHPRLEWFLEQAAELHKRLIVRSNLAILLDTAYRHFLHTYERCGVELVASVPDPAPTRTDRQRGRGTFDKIIEAMRLLNARGYGMNGSGLVLDLVHNPAGAYLAAPQEVLEQEYRRRLSQEYGVSFTRLFCLNNCPIGRFRDYLVASDNLEDYYQELVGAFNPAAAQNVMCRTTLSVGWDGTLYDCDFNQMLGIAVNHGAPATVGAFDETALANREIMLDNHCLVCTAGAGSSCQGTVV